MSFLREDTDLRTFEDMGEGGVKNQGKSGAPNGTKYTSYQRSHQRHYTLESGINVHP